jgi:membrane-associated phospholipid phosphatase
LPVALLTLLLRQRDLAGARSATLTLLIAFYLHYLVYIVIPVVGPLRSGEQPPSVRAAIVAEGGTMTHLLRIFIAAAEKTTEDGFPSAHTSVASLVAALAWKYRLRSRPVFVAIAIAVTSSTVVLGYHYVVDVLAAWPMAWLAWRLGMRFARADEFRQETIARAIDENRISARF